MRDAWVEQGLGLWHEGFEMLWVSTNTVMLEGQGWET